MSPSSTEKRSTCERGKVGRARRRVPRWIVAFIATLLAVGVAMAAQSQFRFRVPEGWIDISPGAPPENLTKVLPQIRAQAESNVIGERLFMAAPPDVAALAMAYLASEADSYPLDGEDFEAARARLGWHGQFVVENGQREVVRGLTWARFTGHTGADPDTRFVCYVIPGNPRSITLLMAAPSASFAQLLPSFDAAARATEGAENPPKRIPGLQFLPLVVIAAGLLSWKRMRTKKPAA